MMPASLARRTLLGLVIAALVAGCAAPQESGPEDLNTDKDRNGLPDAAEQNMSVDGNGTGEIENASVGPDAPPGTP